MTGKRGRPSLAPAGEQPVRIQLTVAPETYDRLYRRAQDQAVSIPELLREGARRVLADDDEHDA